MNNTGVLYIVATPIGNLEDITFRAIKVLNEVSLIAAEDTRHTKKLLSHYGVQTRTVSYFEFNSDSRIPQIIKKISNGESIAVVSDAGTPGISDPSYKLIRAAIKSKIRVESIPGPSACITALVASGLPTDRFIFEGFLPQKKGRKGTLERLSSVDATLIFYESPKKVKRALRDILKYIGDRPAVIARELTKIHEEFIRGTVSELLEHFESVTPRGECVIIIGKDDLNVYF